MKLKRILIMASAAAASSGLLATVLTSCSKSKIDDDLKIALDDSGKFTKSKDFRAAVASALKSSKTWKTFKTALADELVFQWYNDRASTTKDSKDKNNKFRDNLEEWKYNIDEDYKDKVDEYKSKYGSNHKFYLQNELLSAHGGSEESYKHEQLVAKVKEDFVSNVFDKNYFGLAKTEPTGDYPHILTNVESTIYFDDLKNPDSWKRLGFFAKANPSYPVEEIKPNLLAKDPDGDYATIQSYVFDRWFKTEKPFFSAAALFKYSKPAKSEQKMSNIYNVNAVTVPDDPNETFPFFGGMTDSSSTNGLTGTRAFWHWWKQMNKGTFVYDGKYDDASKKDSFNGAISIPKNYTEDSQTLLLCFGSQMIGGASNSLYIPYAISAASLYGQMMTGTTIAVQNTRERTTVEMPITEPLYDDTDIIFKLFFYNSTLPNTISSYLDLTKIYPTGATPYHCPLFKQNDNYKFLYGDDASATNKNGVMYITNNVQINLKPTSETAEPTKGSYEQPWIFELNEAGMHVQTIDCYSFVENIREFYPEQTPTKNEALKRAVMFRLMQKEKNLSGSDIISASVLGKDGALKTYFNDNFADIVLEMAYNEDKGTNIFRNVASFDPTATIKDEDKFLFNTWKNEQLGSTWSYLVDYLKQTSTFDRVKKNHDAVITANDKIYAYRTAQITNSADNKGKKIFENGLLAPLPILYEESPSEQKQTHYYSTTHDYSQTRWIITSGEEDAGFDDLQEIFNSASITNYVNEVTKADIATDSSFGFSLQVAKAKDTLSNRAWFKSAIVDKMMYGYMGDKTLATEIKYDAYNAYDTKNPIPGLDPVEGTPLPESVTNAMASAYKAPKLFTDSKNFASYTPYASNLDFFTVINDAYTNYLKNDITVNGEFSDTQLNEKLFRATIKYLAKDDFANYYKELNRKIGDDIFAFTGYLSKYDTTDHKWMVNEPEIATTKTDFSSYAWKAEVGNIFDQYGYGGKGGITYDKSKARTDYDQYWNVLKNKFTTDTTTKSLSGFLGLQTSASNQLDESSGLKAAVLDKFAISTEGSTDLGGDTDYGKNDGALFQWAGKGVYDKDAADHIKPYEFKDVEYTDDKGVTHKAIKASDFTGDIAPARKLAKRIAESSTVDDLKKLAKAINEKYEGGSVFEMIAKNNYTIDWKNQLNQIKYMMLCNGNDDTIQGAEGLLTKTDGVYKFANAFQRVTNVEVHDEIASPYCFETDKDGYKLIMTELNKSDVIEHTMHPVYNGSTWTMVEDSGITEEEFWFIFFKLASDTTIQQSATADVVKTIYGDDKLVVYDAQLYNQFDAVWIKDWKKKPIGE